MKKELALLMHFKKIISEGSESRSKGRTKPNKIWIDQGSKFYNNSLKMINIEMYSMYNEEESVAAKRFIRTLKNKISKHITAISKNNYFDM